MTIDKYRELGKQMNGDAPIETVILDIVGCLMIARNILKSGFDKTDIMQSASENIAEAFVRLCAFAEDDHELKPYKNIQNIDKEIGLMVFSTQQGMWDSAILQILTFCKHNNIDIEKYCDKLLEEEKHV